MAANPDMNAPASPKKYSDTDVYLRLLGYLKPHIGLFALSIFGFVLYAASQPMLGSLMEVFIDGLSGKRYDLAHLVPATGSVVGDWLRSKVDLAPLEASLRQVKVALLIPVLVVFIYIFRGVGSYLGTFNMARVGFNLVHAVRCEMFDRLLLLPSAYFDQNNSGHIITRFTFNVGQVSDSVARASTVAVREGATVIALMIALLWQSWQLTLAFLLIAPVIGIIVKLSGKRFKKTNRNIQRAVGDVAHVTKETVSSFSVVRSFGGEAYEARRFNEASRRNRQQQIKLSRAREIYTPTLQFIVAVAMAVMMYMALTFDHGMSPGELVAYVTMAGLLPKPMKQLSEVGAQIQRGLVAAEDVFRLIDEPSERDTGTLDCGRVRGDISIRSLDFRYPGADKDVLQDITLDIKAGEMVALVGASGSGKSTLVSLIQRFYDAPAGRIFIDDTDVQTFRLKSLRRQIALVNQQVALFNDTIAANIAYGQSSEPEEAAVWAAADAAFASEFIRRLPGGIGTLVGENGLLLSGGQRQRIAIARAIFKDAPILILDEATSALDTESERYIQQALETVMKGRTTLVIAHRLSTIERADKIVVMERGRIVESGSHAQLLEKGGAYARLHGMQFREDAAGESA